MKSYLITFIGVLMYTSIAAGEKNTEKEKEAIIDLITESTNAYRARDFEKISKTFVHDASILKTGAAKGGFFVRTGWEEIASNYKNNFTTSPAPITRSFEKTNFKVKVYKECAWAMHDESQILEDGTISKQIITHFLEKKGNNWKIVYMSQIFVSSYDTEE